MQIQNKSKAYGLEKYTNFASLIQGNEKQKKGMFLRKEGFWENNGQCQRSWTKLLTSQRDK